MGSFYSFARPTAHAVHGFDGFFLLADDFVDTSFVGLSSVTMRGSRVQHALDLCCERAIRNHLSSLFSFSGSRLAK